AGSRRCQRPGFPSSSAGRRRRTSRTPPKNPRNPRITIRMGLVWNHRSNKYPNDPPTRTAATMTNGSSMAMANCRENPLACFCWGVNSSSRLSLWSEGIARQTCERLRIQSRGQSYKQGRAQRHGLRTAYVRGRRLARFLHPGMHYHTEIVVQRRHDIQRPENRQHRMMRFDERLEYKVLPHEARGRRYARKRKHENQQQQRSRGAALVQPVKVVQFIADQPALAHDNHHG